MSFKPAFSLSSFTFIKGLFNSSSLSFIGVVSLWQKRAASCNFGILAGDDHRSFCSAILMIMEKWRPLKISAPKKKCSYTGGTSGKEPTCRCRRRKRSKFDLWVAELTHGIPLQCSSWRIPWTEEPGGLQSIGSPRVGHDWSDLAHSTHLQAPLGGSISPV